MEGARKALEQCAALVLSGRLKAVATWPAGCAAAFPGGRWRSGSRRTAIAAGVAIQRICRPAGTTLDQLSAAQHGWSAPWRSADAAGSMVVRSETHCWFVSSGRIQDAMAGVQPLDGLMLSKSEGWRRSRAQVGVALVILGAAPCAKGSLAVEPGLICSADLPLPAAAQLAWFPLYQERRFRVPIRHSSSTTPEWHGTVVLAAGHP